MALLPSQSQRLNVATTRARQIFGGFTSGQKAVTGLAALALVVGGVLFVTRSSSGNYTTLFANLQPSQAGQVTQKLTSDQVPYQLEDGGATVLVPQSDVNQERISLAEAGLPAGGTITFQTLASTGITSSEFVQNVDYQQALEGQLASTIESIEGVTSAQVSLVMPQSTSFAIGNTQTPTASVLVDLAAGTTLSSGQVAGIVHLVASAVPSLSTSNVTVVDNNGNVLSSSGADASSGSDDAATTAYDNQLATSLTALLTRVVGPENAAVQVHALLNFNQSQTTTKGFQLGGNGKPLTVPTSDNTTTDKYSGDGAEAAGILGSGTSSTSTGTTDPNGTYTSQQTQTESAVGQVTETVHQAPGQVTQTAVAVLVNSRVVKKSQLASLRSLVTTAAGLNLQRGDSIDVTAMPFSPAVLPPVVKPTAMLAKIEGDAPLIGVVALILVLFFLALRSSRRRRPIFQDIPMVPLEPAPRPSAVAPLLVAAAAHTTSLDERAAAIGPVTLDVDQYISQSPDEVATLIRAWSLERPNKTGATEPRDDGTR